MKIIYLAAVKAFHPDYDVTYQDIDNSRDIGGDMLAVDLNKYDVVIASPPCNFWSICNYRRETSKYAQSTKHLLFETIKKCLCSGKPFLVENVRNFPLMNKYNLFNFPCFVYTIGRHTYWSNILFCTDLVQRQDFRIRGRVIKYEDMNTSYHQGGFNVHQVVEMFLDTVKHNGNL